MAITNKQVTVKIRLTTPMLGTVPKDKEIYKTFIESKKPQVASVVDGLEDDDESSTVGEDEKGVTGFHSDDEGPFIYNYLFKGFMKAALQALKNIDGTAASNIRQNLKMVNNWIFVEPRRIHLRLPEGAVIENLQRPLRAQTMQGERIALANSEMVPEGTEFEINIRWYDADGMDIHVIKDILDYGADKALGQWRNAGYGQIEYFMTDYKEVTISKEWDQVADFPMPAKAVVKPKTTKAATKKNAATEDSSLDDNGTGTDDANVGTNTPDQNRHRQQSASTMKRRPGRPAKLQ